MKKSMLTLVGCVLAAGSVMAAEVAGNNTAVVIQKDAVVSNNYYQFLIVPVKGFDITGTGNAQSLTLAEILPPAAYTTGTKVYKANEDTPTIYTVQDAEWKKDGTTPANGTPIDAGTILWMLTDTTDVASTVFCGELVKDGNTVTPVAGKFVTFGNATSNAIPYANIVNATSEETLKIGVVGGVLRGDQIYLLQEGSSDYLILRYNGTIWTKPNPAGGLYIPANTEADKLPAGAAGYYYRKS